MCRCEQLILDELPSSEIEDPAVVFPANDLVPGAPTPNRCRRSRYGNVVGLRVVRKAEGMAGNCHECENKRPTVTTWLQLIAAIAAIAQAGLDVVHVFLF